VTVRGREIAVFNVGGDFYALLNRRPYERAKLSRSVIVGMPESEVPELPALAPR